MAKTFLHTTSAEPTEIEELSGRVLGIIGAYGMGAALDARNPNPDTAPAAPPREPALAPGKGDIREGVYHLTRRGPHPPTTHGAAGAKLAGN